MRKINRIQYFDVSALSYTKHRRCKIPMKEEGLVLVRDKDKFKEGKQLWEIIRLDTDLHEV